MRVCYETIERSAPSVRTALSFITRYVLHLLPKPAGVRAEQLLDQRDDGHRDCGDHFQLRQQLAARRHGLRGKNSLCKTCVRRPVHTAACTLDAV